ncbi:MAG: heavy-metal-associated domain-containing protein [Mariprofundus sp.]|nr:heavy-metal-associated domain-containing protein [Mariprofundus sp.]
MMRILISLFISGFMLAAPLTSISANELKGQTVTIQVDGLSCPFCAYGLEKNLKKVTGIEGVDIDMKTGKASVAIKAGAQVDDQSLRQAVKKAGFTAREITRP